MTLMVTRLLLTDTAQTPLEERNLTGARQERCGQPGPGLTRAGGGTLLTPHTVNTGPSVTLILSGWTIYYLPSTIYYLLVTVDNMDCLLSLCSHGPGPVSGGQLVSGQLEARQGGT